MKKWIALLLALCLLLPCTALGETAAEEAAEEAAEITPHDIRYYFEHRLLPSELYENTDQLTEYLRYLSGRCLRDGGISAGRRNQCDDAFPAEAGRIPSLQPRISVLEPGDRKSRILYRGTGQLLRRSLVPVQLDC